MAVKKIIKENVSGYFRVSFRLDGNDGIAQINLVKADDKQEAIHKLKEYQQKRNPDRELEIFGAHEVSNLEFDGLKRRGMPIIETTKRSTPIKENYDEYEEIAYDIEHTDFDPEEMKDIIQSAALSWTEKSELAQLANIHLDIPKGARVGTKIIENLDSEAHEVSFKQGQVFKNSMGKKLVVHNIKKDGTLEIGQIKNYKGEDIVDYVSASTNKSFEKMLKDNGYKLYKDNIKENKSMIKKQISLKEGLEDHDMEWVDEQLEWFSNGNGTFEEFYNFCSEIDCIPTSMQDDIVYNDWMGMKHLIQGMLNDADSLADFLPVLYNQFNGVDSPEDEFFKVDGYGHYKDLLDEDIDLYLDEVKEMIQEKRQELEEYEDDFEDEE